MELTGVMQMEYAALDAACLLGLLEAYARSCIPSSQGESIPSFLLLNTVFQNLHILED